MQEFLKKHRARVAAQGLRKTLLYYLFTVALGRLGLELMYIFEYLPGRSALREDPRETRTSLIDSSESLTALDREALVAYGGADLLREFAEGFARGERCGLIRLADGRLASVCWVVPTDRYYPEQTSSCLLMERAFTLPHLRGRALFPIMLARVGELVCARPGAQRVFAKISIFNESSIRGFERAGFKRIGRLIFFGGAARYRPLPAA